MIIDTMLRLTSFDKIRSISKFSSGFTVASFIDRNCNIKSDQAGIRLISSLKHGALIITQDNQKEYFFPVSDRDNEHILNSN